MHVLQIFGCASAMLLLSNRQLLVMSRVGRRAVLRLMLIVMAEFRYV